jgi:6-phospho-beta-glucosidase
MADAAGADIKFEAKADRLEAFAGSDYILTSFRQGGFEMRIHDEQIPLKYDVIGNETVGPGGFFYGMRTVVEVKGMIADFEKACPNAIILNYTNPTNIVTEALCRYSSMNIYGMCDQRAHDARFFAGFWARAARKSSRRALA